jgi:hypothetical protein
MPLATRPRTVDQDDEHESRGVTMHPAFREELLREHRHELESRLRFAPPQREDELAARRKRRSLRARFGGRWTAKPAPAPPSPRAA